MCVTRSLLSNIGYSHSSCVRRRQQGERRRYYVSSDARAVAVIKTEEQGSTASLHFLGIGGSGLSALAVVALSQAREELFPRFVVSN